MRTNEEKLDLFADILEPAAAIAADKTWMAEFTAGNKIKAIQTAIRGHKRELVDIFARIEGEDPATYQIDGVSLFFRLARLTNRPDLDINDLFTSQAQKDGSEFSGPATANTGDAEN